MLDERLVPDGLFEQHDSCRFFTRLGAALAKFYFATEGLLLAGARRQVLEELSARVAGSPAKEQVLSLKVLNAVNWKVECTCIEVNVMPILQKAFNRAKEVDQARGSVTSDPEILGGTPVFSGTRVPVENVLSSLDKGISLARLKRSYPFITHTHIDSARVYEAVHPKLGQPRRLAELSPDITHRVTRFTKRSDGA